MSTEQGESMDIEGVGPRWGGSSRAVTLQEFPVSGIVIHSAWYCHS
jgi:hypothetical protein